MSWGGVLVLCAAAYALKAIGAFVGERVAADGAARGSLELMVVPVLAALILTQTIGAGSSVVLDARLPAVAVAALLIWRRAPLLVVVLAAGATAALLRLVAG